MNIENKLRPIYIAKILLERTDEDHVLTTNELIDILEHDYHISAHRTTISEDKETLIGRERLLASFVRDLVVNCLIINCLDLIRT